MKEGRRRRRRERRGLMCHCAGKGGREELSKMRKEIVLGERNMTSKKERIG